LTNYDNAQIHANGIRGDFEYKLKPDTYDGGTPLREFFSQFDLIAGKLLKRCDKGHSIGCLPEGEIALSS